MKRIDGRFLRAMGLSLVTSVILALAVGPAQAQQRKNARAQRATAEEQADILKAALPKVVEKLNITDQQKQQIMQIVKQHNEKMRETWQQYETAQMRQIKLQALMLAAIEDRMGKEKVEEFRKARKERLQELRQAFLTRRQGGTAEQPQGRRRVGFRPSSENEEEGILIIAVTSPRHYFDKLGLNEEQQQKCEAAFKAYTGTLRRNWQQLRTYHEELVDMEADKMTAIAKVLTEEQRQQLRNLRQKAESLPEASEEESTSTKTKTNNNN
jgi:hypothetical protein